MRLRQKVILWMSTGAIVVGLAALSVHSGPMVQDLTEIPFHQGEAEQVVQALQTGTLHPDAQGIVVLPRRWADVAKDGRVYVTQDTHGISIVLFPTFRAAGWFNPEGNFEGDIYCHAPSDVDPPLHGQEGLVNLVGPRPASSWNILNGAWTAARQYAYVTDRVGPNWYAVYTDND